MPRNFTPAHYRFFEKKETEKCITQLVVKLESVFTTPDKIYMKQEDDCIADPSKDNNASNDDDETDAITEPYMYFIRNGKFSVNIRTDYLNPNPNLDDDIPNGAPMVDG